MISVWVRECLTELVPFKVFVSDTLFIGLHTLDGKKPVPLVQPPAVKLAVRDDKKEDNSDENLE